MSMQGVKRTIRRALAALAAWMALLPLPARADPISIFVAVEALAGATVAAAVATVVSYVTYYATALMVAAQVFGGMDARRRARHAAEDARRAYNASLTDRTTVALTADPPLRAIYGRCIVGGDVVAVLTSDKLGVRDDGSTYTRPDALKHVVIVIAARQIHAIHDVLIEGVALGALDAEGWPINSDTVRTVRAYREVAVAAGGAFTVASAIQVLSVWDAEGTWVGGGYGESYDPAVFSGRDPHWTLSSDGRTFTNTSGFPVRASLAYDTRQGSVRVSKFLGTEDQVADPWLRANVGGKWLAADRLRGKAGIVLTLDLEDTSHQSGIPKVEVDASGFLLYDPRTGTTGWSANPALVIRDYLTSELGFAVDAGDIDDDYVRAAANACDALVSIDGSMQPTYTCNGTVSSDDDREAVLDDLAECMAGQVVQGAAWMPIAGTWTAPVMDLGDSDLAGQAEVVQGGTALDDLFNGARARIIPAGSGTVDEPVPYQNAAFLAADGEPLWTDVQLPFTNSRQRARNVLRVLVERNRAGLVMRVPCTMRAWPLQVGDRVRWSSREYGFTNAYMQVLDWQFGQGTPVMLVLQADAPEIYDQADAGSASTTQESSLPRPWVVDPVIDLSAVSGTSTLLLQADGTVVPRVRVAWAAMTDPYLFGGGVMRVRWRRPMVDGAEVWQGFDVGVGDRSAWIDGVAEGDLLVIYVQAINRFGAAGPAASVAHTVVGKSAAASNVVGLVGAVTNGRARFSWRACQDIDYAASEVRSADVDWGRADPGHEPLWRGSGSEYSEAVSATGSLTRYVRHIDSTGHPSAVSASTTLVVTAEGLAGAIGMIGGGNLVGNSGFLAHNGALPTGWGLYNYSGVGVLASQVLPGGLFGANFIRVSVSGALPATCGIYVGNNDQQVKSWVPGETYVITCWVRAASANMVGKQVRLDYSNQGFTAVTYIEDPLLVEGAWRRVSMRGKPGDNIHTVKGELYISTVENTHPIGGAYDICAVQVELGEIPTTWAPSGRDKVGIDNPLTDANKAAIGYLGDLNASADISLVLRGVTRSGNTLTKISGTGAWDADAYSVDSYTGGAYAIASPAQISADLMFGLNSDPTTNANWNTLDYAWWFLSGRCYVLIDNGATVVDRGTYTIGASWAITYDGSRVRWLCNGQVEHELVRTDSSNLYFDSSFSTPGGALLGCRFGPMSSNNWAAVGGIGKPQDNATVGAPAGTSVGAIEASALVTQAATAYTNAQDSLSVLATMRSNGYIDAAEKPALIKEWTSLSAAHDDLLSQAAALGVTTERTNYANAKEALGVYLGNLSPAWNNTSTDTPITPAVDQSYWSDFYAKRQILLAKMAQVASTMATWAGVTGVGKPADGATKNSVTYGSSAPSGPTDGDLWCDTSVTPRVWRIRLGGAWQAAASFVTSTADISDGAQLGLTAVWSGVTGAGRPADGATVNRLSYSTSAPSSPVDGDIWVDTSGSPATIKLRTSGGWVSGANLSTGVLAQLNSVNTTQIDAGSATVVHVATAAGVTVTGLSGVPIGSFTDVVSYTWTPPYSCLVEIAVDGTATITTPSSSAGWGNQFAILYSRLVLNGTSQDSPKINHIGLDVGYSNTVYCGVQRNKQVAVTGGVTYTIVLQAQKSFDAVSTVIDTVNLKLVEIRR